MKEWQSKHRDKTKSPQGSEGRVFGGGKNTAIRTMATPLNHPKVLSWFTATSTCRCRAPCFKTTETLGSLACISIDSTPNKSGCFVFVWNLYTYILIYLYTYILIYLYTYILIYLYIYILIYLYTYILIYYILIYLYTYILIYLYTYILIYLYTYILIYLYTYITYI